MNEKKYTGYHGTSKVFYKKIMDTNFVESNHGWLGRGVYFFDKSVIRAIDWAEYAHKGRHTEVIKAELKIPEQLVFDTTRDDHEEEFHRFRNNIVDSNLKRGKFSVKIKNETDFDGKIYNAICNVKNAVLVRAKTFTQPNLERGKYIPVSRVPNAVELCLKNINYVNSKSRVDISQEEGLM